MHSQNAPEQQCGVTRSSTGLVGVLLYHHSL